VLGNIALHFARRQRGVTDRLEGRQRTRASQR
jgi:hypothetical protein